jgi:hypothetical protein
MGKTKAKIDKKAKEKGLDLQEYIDHYFDKE